MKLIARLLARDNDCTNIFMTCLQDIFLTTNTSSSASNNNNVDVSTLQDNSSLEEEDEDRNKDNHNNNTMIAAGAVPPSLNLPSTTTTTTTATIPVVNIVSTWKSIWPRKKIGLHFDIFSCQIATGMFQILTHNLLLLPSLTIEHWEIIFFILSKCSKSKSYATFKSFEVSII
jgi:hypothetical protein